MQAGGGAKTIQEATEANGSCRGRQPVPQVSIVPILFGVGGTIYKEQTINALTRLGVSST
eukprot:365884-Chlamydomonas_euryale.AAC.3